MIAANLITRDVYLIERNVCSQACWGFLKVQYLHCVHSVPGAAVCATYRCACRGAHDFGHRHTLYRKLVIYIIIIIIPCTKRNYNRIFVAREKIKAEHRMQSEKKASLFHPAAHGKIQFENGASARNKISKHRCDD